MTSAWDVLLAPMDSAGKHEGEERAPAALLAAGLLDAVGADWVDTLPTGIQAPDRDGATGVIGLRDLERSSATLRSAVHSSILAGGRPLVVGGDCAIVPGVMAGAVDAVDDLGLLFLDGHLDALDGRSSPTGEAADMDLAVLTGHGPATLDFVLGRHAVIPAERIAAIGFRADAPADIALADGRLVNETALVDPAVHRFDADRTDPRRRRGDRCPRPRRARRRPPSALAAPRRRRARRGGTAGRQLSTGRRARLATAGGAAVGADRRRSTGRRPPHLLQRRP